MYERLIKLCAGDRKSLSRWVLNCYLLYFVRPLSIHVERRVTQLTHLNGQHLALLPAVAAAAAAAGGGGSFLESGSFPHATELPREEDFHFDIFRIIHSAMFYTLVMRFSIFSFHTPSLSF